MRGFQKTMLALLLATPLAWGQLGDQLRSQFHKEEELGLAVVGSGEQSRIPSILQDSKNRILALQLTQGELDESQVAPLLDWVRAGHSLWLYDARLTPWFGFAPVMMKREQFTNKNEKGDLGGKGYEGVATTAIAMGGHPANTGVGQISAFLPRFTPDQEVYGAVNVTADTVPLIRFTITSPAIAALRREGRGLIVFKPLIWPEAVSGDRFQSNLLEFSAGYQIPAPGGEGKVGNPPGPNAEYVQGKPATAMSSTGSVPPPLPPPPPPPNPNLEATPPLSPTADALELIGEAPLQGRVVNEKLRFETSSASMQLERGQVEWIELSSNGQLDVVHWRDGHTSKGFLLEKKIEFEVAGESRTLERKAVKAIRWGKAGNS